MTWTISDFNAADVTCHDECNFFLFSSFPSSTRDAKKAKNIKDLSERFLIAQSIKSSDNWKVTSSTIKWLSHYWTYYETFFPTPSITDELFIRKCVETLTAITHALIRFGIWIWISSPRSRIWNVFFFLYFGYEQQTSVWELRLRSRNE